MGGYLWMENSPETYAWNFHEFSLKIGHDLGNLDFRDTQIMYMYIYIYYLHLFAELHHEILPILSPLYPYIIFYPHYIKLNIYLNRAASHQNLSALTVRGGKICS